MSETKEKRSLFPLHVAIVFAFMFLFRYIPAPAPMTQLGMAIIGIFIGMIYGWTFTADRGLAWTTFAGLIALGLTDTQTCATSVMQLFSSNNSILILLGMLMIGPVIASNMGNFLVVKLIKSKLCYQKPWNFTILMIAVVPLLQLLINPWIVILFLLPILANVFKAAGYQKGDKYPVMFIIGFFMVLEVVVCFLPWKGWGLYCVSAFASASGGYTIDFAGYIIISLIFYVVFCVAYILLMKVMGCNIEPMRNIDVASFIEGGQEEMTKHQKGVLIAMIAMAIGCILVSFVPATTAIGAVLTRIGVHGVMMITLVVMLIIRVDGKPLGTIEAAGKSIAWDMLLVITGAMVIANALTAPATGVSAWVGAVAGPILAGKSELVVIVLLAIFTLVMTNLSNNTAVMFVFMAVAGSLYSAGVLTNAPATMLIITYASIMGYYTPGSSAYGAAIHSFDLCTSGTVYKYGFITMVLVLVCMLITIVPLSFILF